MTLPIEDDAEVEEIEYEDFIHRLNVGGDEDVMELIPDLDINRLLDKVGGAGQTTESDECDDSSLSSSTIATYRDSCNYKDEHLPFINLVF